MALGLAAPRSIRMLGLVLVVAVHLCDLQVFNSIAGPFRVIPGHLEECPPEQRPKSPIMYYQYSSMRDRRLRDVWLYSANITLLETADDHFSVSVNFASWSSMGGWKDNALIVTLPRACSAVKRMMPRLWDMGIGRCTANVTPIIAACIFPPGLYKCNNISTEFEIKIPPTFFYGNWRGTFRIFNPRTGSVRSCEVAYFSIVPKIRKKNEKP